MIISTSYFYQIRHFKRNMLPVSTAVYDPAWFYNKNGPSRVYRDRNGIWNGVRFPTLSPMSLGDGLCDKTRGCTPDNCIFITKYREYINSLDFQKVYNALEVFSKHFASIEKIDDVHIVLIVHETPSNLCSERGVLQEYFTRNGIECRELEYPIK